MECNDYAAVADADNTAKLKNEIVALVLAHKPRDATDALLDAITELADVHDLVDTWDLCDGLGFSDLK